MKVVVATFLALASVVDKVSAVDLYEREYSENTSSNKPLIATIREVERANSTSTFVVELKSGASVPSSMAILRAAYDVAKIRGKAYFVNLKEWDDGLGRRHYVIGYSDRKEVNPLIFFGIKDSSKNAAEIRYLDVASFDSVFKGKSGTP